VGSFFAVKFVKNREIADDGTEEKCGINHYFAKETFLIIVNT